MTSLGAPRPDLRLVVPVAVAWVVAVVLVASPAHAVPVAVAAGVAAATAVLVVLQAVRRGRAGPPPRAHSGPLGVVGLVAPTLLLVALVAVAVDVRDAVRRPEAIRAIDDGAAVVAEVVLERDGEPGERTVPGRLVRMEHRAGGETITTTGLRVPARVVLAEPGSTEHDPGASDVAVPLVAGATVRVHAELVAGTPGATASVLLFTRGDPEVVHAPAALLLASTIARRAFAEVTGRLPGPGAGLLRGLAIGDRSGIDDRTADAMEVTALTHLTAVSGSNCAVLVGLVMLVGRAARAPRLARVVVSVVVLGAFVLLVRPDPSIVRATIMAVVVLVVHLRGRPVHGAPLVALATIGMLVVDPWLARSFGFALSVLATAGVVVVAPVLASRLAGRLGPVVAASLAVPVAAQAACWPVTVVLAPSIPTYAVLTNLVTEPLAPVATVLGLAACALAPIWSTGAWFLAAAAWAPAAVIAVVARAAAALPFAVVPWPAGPFGAATAALVSTAVVAAVFVRRAARAVPVAAAVVVGVIGVSVVVVPDAVVRGSVPADWSLAACDVGQGDAVLVRRDDAVALVDTGDEPERLERCLDLLGIDRIDLFVASHYDRDHVGAVGVVANRVGTALVGPLGRAADADVVATLRRAGADVVTAGAGTAGTLGDLPWRVVWPPPSTTEGGNDASVTVLFEPSRRCSDCLSSLFLGDLGEAAQRRLLAMVTAAGGWPPVDVVKVAHHGSADQDPALYRAVSARVGIVSVGADNPYGHPTDRALAMLEAAGTAALRTDQNGTIVLSASGGDLRVWRERPDRGDPTTGVSPVARTLLEVGRVGARRGPGRARSGPPTSRAGGTPWRRRDQRAQPRRSTRSRGRRSGRHRSSS
ncbi:ComEC/Rec2 family competence protein [Curtobacterium sp. MCBD17_003]|uniref:ComEC/Rec2 family competence protein n=1 Tax=Curtobacterium sp. MCBD17_003 TaxID=2175667 RepID=UPI000DA86E2E|nr:ComEC/Rec2 family competence protein [Curtobacterium sp. MCBD17_003]WIE55836.1 ComEC/Rec2 family competence protein [Curtobacterium sp. MCBD17_003]